MLPVLARWILTSAGAAGIRLLATGNPCPRGGRGEKSLLLRLHLLWRQTIRLGRLYEVNEWHLASFEPTRLLSGRLPGSRRTRESWLNLLLLGDLCWMHTMRLGRLYQGGGRTSVQAWTICFGYKSALIGKDVKQGYEPAAPTDARQGYSAGQRIGRSLEHRFSTEGRNLHPQIGWDSVLQRLRAAARNAANMSGKSTMWEDH
ncbi:hypothetical protein FB45DRAFT_874223 [Roridomyces roridus]|uniref:Uncharacterized protein n=1 Tax=Roridomyces roridus TaxID=1738132 RepID=A0AAD7B988_9AGAR|nr:hypothetical protein FB45DRAFT_874223 [Roridomyces roridus]